MFFLLCLSPINFRDGGLSWPIKVFVQPGVIAAAPQQRKLAPPGFTVLFQQQFLDGRCDEEAVAISGRLVALALFEFIMPLKHFLGHLGFNDPAQHA